MRPEYIEAVNAAQRGWSYWLIWTLPAALIWLSALAWLLPQRVEHRLALGKYSVPVLVNVTCIIAMLICWMLIVFHVNHVQWVKHRLAEMPEEWVEYSADTPVTFAPITGAFYAFGYCILQAVPANAIGFIAGRFVGRLKRRTPPSDGWGRRGFDDGLAAK